MGDEYLEKEILEEINPIVEDMGYKIVEIKVGRTKGLNKVTIIIYRQGGISLKNCEDVSKMVLPHLELMDDLNDLSLEVSSPGINRVIKNEREYDIFSGRGIQIFLRGEYETENIRYGILENTDDEYIYLRESQKTTRYRKDSIRKAKLRDIKEVVK